MDLRNLCRAAAVVVLLCASQAAFAQYESDNRSRLGIGVALIRPTGSHLKNLSNTWLGPTVDFYILYDSLSRPTLTASLGWFGQEKDMTTANLVPLRLTYIKRFGGETGSRWYAGGGVDVYIASYKGYEYNQFTRTTEYVDESGMPIGVSLLAGIEFGGAWYGEARYDALSGLSLPTGGSVNFSGLSLGFGSRMAF
jgi:hypothetical protein